MLKYAVNQYIIKKITTIWLKRLSSIAIQIILSNTPSTTEITTYITLPQKAAYSGFDCFS